MAETVEKILGEALTPLDATISLVKFWESNSGQSPAKLERLTKDVRRICNKLRAYEKHSLKMFGSALSGFATHDSAVDLCACFDTPDPGEVRRRLKLEFWKDSEFLWVKLNQTQNIKF